MCTPEVSRGAPATSDRQVTCALDGSSGGGTALALAVWMFLVFLVILPPALATSPAEAAPMRAEAQRLYDAKDYAGACALFRTAAAAEPADAALQADLGVCELHVGHRVASIAASRRAVQLGDADVRLAAYANLHLAGVRFVYPEDWTDHEQGCQRVGPDFSSGEPAWVCWRNENGTGSGVFAFDSAVVVYLGGAPDFFDRKTRSLELEQPHARQLEPLARQPLWTGDGLDLVSSNEERPGYDRDPSAQTTSAEEHRCDIVSIDVSARRVGLWCTEGTAPVFNGDGMIGREVRPSRTWVTEIGAGVFWTAAD